MKKRFAKLRGRLSDDRGDMLQYVLIACLIAVVCIVPFTKLGKGIAQKVDEIVAYLTGKDIPTPPSPDTGGTGTPIKKD